MTRYRVLVVDDSAFMRAIVSDLVTKDEQFEVVATASNGKEAIDAVDTFKPDAVTMDLEMPVMNGLEALKQIMAVRPLPVIMLSGISDENTRDTIKALQSGAFDFIRKPAIDGSVDIEQVGGQLLDKLRIAVLVGRSRLKPEARKPTSLEAAMPPADRKRPGGKPAAKAELTEAADRAGTSKRAAKSAQENGSSGSSPQVEKTAKAATKPAKPAASKEKQEQSVKAAVIPSEPAETGVSNNKPKGSTVFDSVVLIGTSTGGPKALHEVICSLPSKLAAPVLVVQHMPPNFTRSLAQRLDAFSAVRVTEAVQGERVETGTVYIAPGGYHMELAKDRSGYYVNLTLEEARSGHRPSVDVLFESAVRYSELNRHAVIMTGMGSDGAKGMKALRDSGARTTIAESEQTCVVYGMPRSAVEIGAVTDVLPLSRIAGFLASALGK
ncbi:protein-glutamate methylesterase/protein-glutamine glutaminase [Paenibacillus kobensis]|uniref:protein-glutamate methylesterase/protein-glutamine glutaminase n=1 Tax=Paenibacillus kobensis TaxID=59841 RepID=UPI000FDC1CCD|nr:chemotaxis response regulator protein-glutamate methylesterase [Paenibacillus kobensis]